MQHTHATEELGRYTEVSGKGSTITYAVEWCPECRAAYQRPVAFEDGIRWGPGEREAALTAGREGRQRCVAALRKRREEASGDAQAQAADR